jgi:hypothetical protein
MSKNLTLKGAAFGALVALSVASVAPASAVVNDSAVSLVPVTGTQYSIVQDNVFDLKSDQSLAAVAGSGNLKFLVTDAAGVIKFDYDEDTAASSDSRAAAATVTDISVDDDAAGDTITLTFGSAPGLAVGDVATVAGVTGTTNGTTALSATQLAQINRTVAITAISGATVTYAVADNSVFAADLGASATAAGGTATGLTSSDLLDTRLAIATAPLGDADSAGVATTRAADKSFVVDTGDDDTANTDVLRLVSTAAAGTSATATVTAWIDENGNGTIENTEDSSSTRTVIFTPWASSGAALTIDQPVAAGTTWKGAVSFNSDINASQITDGRLAVGLGFVIDGAIVDGATSTTASAGAFTAGDPTQYNSTNGNWEIENGSGAAGAAVAYDWATGTDNEFRAGYSYAAQIFLDGAAYGSVVYKSTSTAVADAVGYVGADKTVNTKYNGTTGVTVRSGTKSVVVSSKVTKSSAAVAGAPVTVSVAYSSLHVDSTITVNGSSFNAASSSAAKTISYAATTGADGKVNVTIANSGAKANDAVTVTVVQAGISSTATTVSWADVDHTATKLDEAANINNSIRNIAKGGSFTLNYIAADEFGAAPTTTWRILATYTFLGSGQTQVVKDIPVVDGKASLSITDASTANGSYNVVAKLQKLNTSTGNYDDVDPAGGATAIELTTAVYVGAASTPASATISVVEDTASGTGINLEAADFVALDSRVNANIAAHGFDTDEDFEISGIISDVNGIAVPGASVTVTSDAGDLVAFLTDGVVTIGSATVVANASGSYSVVAYSHKAGDIKFTATSGAAVKTADAVQADNSSTAADIKNVVFAAESSITAGSSTPVKFTVVDKWGNAVNDANAVTVTFAGLGALSSYPTAVSATGTATVTLTTSAGAAGSATITVKAAAGAATTDDVTVAKVITITDPVAEKAAAEKAAAEKAAAEKAAAEKLANTPDSVTVTVGSATVTSGLTTDVTVVVKNAAGAVIANKTVAITTAGAGYTNAATVTTDSNGKAVVKFISGVNESGAATVTASVEGKTGSASITVAKPVVIVPEVKTTIVGVTKAIRVRVENAKGEEVEIVVGGKTVAVATAGTNSKLWVVAAPKGAQSVKVYVDGDLVAVKTVTVK